MEHESWINGIWVISALLVCAFGFAAFRVYKTYNECNEQYCSYISLKLTVDESKEEDGLDDFLDEF